MSALSVKFKVFKLLGYMQLVRTVPGSLEAQILLARTKMVCGQLEFAQQTCNHCIKLEPTSAEAHLLSALIAFHQENYVSCQQLLDQVDILVSCFFCFFY